MAQFYPTFAKDGFELEAVEQTDGLNHPFLREPIPSDEHRHAVQPGDLVKLIFKYRDAVELNGHTFTGEHMWVKITGYGAGHLVGRLDNDPQYTSLITSGDPVCFHPKHIVKIWSDDLKDSFSSSMGNIYRTDGPFAPGSTRDDDNASFIPAMGDYSPEKLSAKWVGKLQSLLLSIREQWEPLRPRKTFLPFLSRETDLNDDVATPWRTKNALLHRGRVVFGLVSRAYFPAYVPGRRTHYGSVVYALDSHEPDSIFELAWGVNQLRADDSSPPHGTEKITAAMRDDRSRFVRLRLPEEVGAHGEAYLANLCVHRTRLPGGYLHDRLLPLLVAPEETEWCCILPLRGWTPLLKEIWLDGPPANNQEEFKRRLARFRIKP